MAAVNFAIGSDFKWVLLAMALIWAGSIAAYLVESVVALRSGASEGQNRSASRFN